MLQVYKTTLKISDSYSNIIGHMCYAASKLWNVCNYERYNYKELNLEKYPNWYYQKKYHKDDLWFKQLPSQTAQEVCKLLDKSWKSFYKLLETHGIENPRPPKYKQVPIAITYMQNAVVHEVGSDKVRLSLPKKLMKFMSDEYGISEKFIYIENKIFSSTDTIKQIKIYPPEGNTCRIIIIYEIPDPVLKEDNGNYLSIDIGLHNLMTCYNSSSSETFIVGRKYLSICHYYYKEIARVQSQWSQQQHNKGIKYPKSSKHIRHLYTRKNNAINDYLHKITRYIVSYCCTNDINTVIIGDLTNIREDNDKGAVINQELHALPFRKLYVMLGYKLNLVGINLVMQNEAYSSQTSPLKDSVSKENAEKSNRIERGLYRDNEIEWNADCVGAFNILRLYLAEMQKQMCLNPLKIQSPTIIKVAV